VGKSGTEGIICHYCLLTVEDIDEASVAFCAPGITSLYQHCSCVFHLGEAPKRHTTVYDTKHPVIVFFSKSSRELGETAFM